MTSREQAIVEELRAAADSDYLRADIDCGETADLIQAQSARIAELEAELDRFRESNRGLGEQALRVLAERDAVRKALAWLASDNRGKIERDRVFAYRSRVVLDGVGSVGTGRIVVAHDGTPESVEAALLAVAREVAK